MRQNSRFLATEPRSGTKPGFLRSDLARNPAFSGAKGVQQAAKSQVGKNDERQKGSGAPRRVPERGFVAKNARFCCTIEKGARKWSKDAHPKRETTRMEGTASKRCAVRMLHPKRLVTPKGPHQARHRPPATAPCIAEERGAFASSPAMFADGTAAFASSAAPAATSPAPAATALCQHRARRGIAALLASRRLQSRFLEEASEAGRIARSHLHSQLHRRNRVLGGAGTPSR